MQIAAFDTDDLADGSGKAHISWIGRELLKTSHRMNPVIVTNEDGTYKEGTGSIGGWERCEMRSYLKETILPLIPGNIRSQIKETIKEQRAIDASGSGFKQITHDDLWIPESSELRKYDIFTVRSSYIKLKVDNNKAYSWWTRGSDSASVNFFTLVHNDGNSGAYGAQSSEGVCLCFCT